MQCLLARLSGFIKILEKSRKSNDESCQSICLFVSCLFVSHVRNLSGQLLYTPRYFYSIVYKMPSVTVILWGGLKLLVTHLVFHGTCR